MLVTYKVKGFKTPSHWTTKLKTIYLPNPPLIKEKMRRKRLAKWARWMTQHRQASKQGNVKKVHPEIHRGVHANFLKINL